MLKSLYTCMFHLSEIGENLKLVIQCLVNSLYYVKHIDHLLLFIVSPVSYENDVSSYLYQISVELAFYPRDPRWVRLIS